MNQPLPDAAKVFVSFGAVLRTAGFSVAPEQVINFVAAVELLGPREMPDIYKAARATLGPQPDQIREFDALYQQHFFDATLSMPMAGEDEDELNIDEAKDEAADIPDATEVEESGGEATAAEVLSVRRFDLMAEHEALRQFARQAPASLPTRHSRRWQTTRRGSRYDLKRSLRDAVRRDGEVLSLAALKRRRRQRQVLLLIDVSGSMKDFSESHFRFAHTLARVCQRLEVFTVGTRLTRVTRAVRLRHETQALNAVSAVVADFDGGTRLGDALQAFLAVPRFSGFVRGAVVLVLSDGFERGDHTRLTDAMRRVSRLSWRTLWLTPLAGDAAYTPKTEALVSILPFIDEIGDASSVQRLCADVIDLARAA